MGIAVVVLLSMLLLLAGILVAAVLCAVLLVVALGILGMGREAVRGDEHRGPAFADAAEERRARMATAAASFLFVAFGVVGFVLLRVS